MRPFYKSSHQVKLRSILVTYDCSFCIMLYEYMNNDCHIYKHSASEVRFMILDI